MSSSLAQEVQDLLLEVDEVVLRQVLYLKTSIAAKAGASVSALRF